MVSRVLYRGTISRHLLAASRVRVQGHVPANSVLAVFSTSSVRFQSSTTVKSETKTAKTSEAASNTTNGATASKPSELTADKAGESKELLLKKDMPTTTVAKVATEPEVVKPPLWDRIKHEVAHYWSGTKLLGYEIKVSTKLLVKMMSGYGLSRRESNQLQRTLVDVARLIPFSMFVLVPFAELLLPVALKLFPNLLPSTYELSSDAKKKKARLLKARTASSEFIKQTMEQSGLKLLKKISEKEKQAFVSFFDIISNGKTPTREHLIQVARLFKNDQVLDNLSRPQLVAMANYMSLRPFGTDSILRYQIRHRLLTIIKDDKAIDYEGVESLTVPELQMACSQRGIKTQDVSPGRLREDLETWLDLRLRQKIPSTLLILSSAYTYGEHTQGIDTYYDALLAVLSSIPDEVYNVAKLELSHDAKLKLNILKEQEELINEENQREKHTVNQIKDNIKLDELEEAQSGGMKIEQDEPTEVSESKSSESESSESQPSESKASESKSTESELEKPKSS
ncbi:CIC11C00000000354 [Sungouiella intermedia]|uniref:CIC11C00000000354 n=1 Tax=Sungouiella intermedia TaxID=45354 RepID=A0A1L0BCY8_9ASCO|nr:CIC11C00000000354 [[Candida] intermedia]